MATGEPRAAYGSRVLINNSSSNTTTFPEWGKIKHGVSQGWILGPLFFLICINDLPNIIADPSKPILFADNTSIIITNPSPSKFKEDINNIIDNVNGSEVTLYHKIWIKPTFYNLGLKLFMWLI